MRFSDSVTGTAFPPIVGQRDPLLSFRLANVDFRDKTYLDIGCNTGGMILAQLPYTRKAVGIDFDATAITVIDGIRSKLGLDTDVLELHSFDHFPSIDCDNVQNPAVCAERQCLWTRTGSGQGRCGPRDPVHESEMPLTIKSLPLNSILSYGATPIGPNFNENGRYDIISMFAINNWLYDPIVVMEWCMDHSRTFIIEIHGSKSEVTDKEREMVNALMAKCPGTVEKTDASICTDCGGNRMFTVTQSGCWPGCTNSAATNYERRATMDDGTCVIPGCTSSTATNYNSAATTDDGSCYTMNADGSCDCTGCYGTTTGVCIQSNMVCHPFDNSGACPVDTTLCGCPSV